MKIDVSVIIVNYNTQYMTLNCIDSVYIHTKGVKFEVIVADNASRECEKNLLSNDNRIQFLALDKNYGFGAANNKAARIAKGKYLFFLNSDTLLLSDSISLLFKQAEALNGLCSLGGICHEKDGEIHGSISFYTMTIALLDAIRNYCFMGDRHIFHQKYCFDNKLCRVHAISGADLFLAKDIFDNMLHGFDETFFFYFEDLDIGKRLAEYHIPAYLVEYADIIHFRGSSTRNFFKHYSFLRNLFIYARKNYSSTICFLFRILYGILMLPFILFHYRFTWNEKLSLCMLFVNKSQ